MKIAGVKEEMENPNFQDGSRGLDVIAKTLKYNIFIHT